MRLLLQLNLLLPQDRCKMMQLILVFITLFALVSNDATDALAITNYDNNNLLAPSIELRAQVVGGPELASDHQNGPDTEQPEEGPRRKSNKDSDDHVKPERMATQLALPSIRRRQSAVLLNETKLQRSLLINDKKEARTFNLMRKIWSKPRVSPLYLLDGTVCRFVNLQPVCTTLTTTGVIRASGSGGSSGGGGGGSSSSGSGGGNRGGSSGGSGGGGGGSSGSGGGGGSSGSGGGSSSSGTSGGSGGGNRGTSGGGGGGGSSGGSGGGSGSGSGGSSGSGGGGSGGQRPQSSGSLGGGSSSVQFVASRNGQIALRPATLMDDESPDLSAEASNKLAEVQLASGGQQPINYLLRTRRRPINLFHSRKKSSQQIGQPASGRPLKIEGKREM